MWTPAVGRLGERMKEKIIIFICCLCLIGCKKNQFQANEKKNVNSQISDKVEMQIKNEIPKVETFNDSLSEEKNIESYKDLLFFLWDKNDFIQKNYDTINKSSREYKMNETMGPGTTFVNNELLAESPIKIGMNKNEVYKLLGKPERLITQDNKETIEYNYSMYVPNHNNVEEKFFASTGLSFAFDENTIITKIYLLVEWIEEPIVDSDLF